MTRPKPKKPPTPAVPVPAPLAEGLGTGTPGHAYRSAPPGLSDPASDDPYPTFDLPTDTAFFWPDGQLPYDVYPTMEAALLASMKVQHRCVFAYRRLKWSIRRTSWPARIIYLDQGDSGMSRELMVGRGMTDADTLAAVRALISTGGLLKAVNEFLCDEALNS